MRKNDWIIKFLLMVCVLQWNARSLVANGQEFEEIYKRF